MASPQVAGRGKGGKRVLGRCRRARFAVVAGLLVLAACAGPTNESPKQHSPAPKSPAPTNPASESPGPESPGPESPVPTISWPSSPEGRPTIDVDKFEPSSDLDGLRPGSPPKIP